MPFCFIFPASSSLGAPPLSTTSAPTLVAAMLWYNQGDAAAKVGAEFVDGGGAPKLGDAGKTKQKGTKGKKK